MSIGLVNVPGDLSDKQNRLTGQSGQIVGFDAFGNLVPLSSDSFKGEKGDTGDVGPQGPKGDTGATGPQGPMGTSGLSVWKLTASGSNVVTFPFAIRFLFYPPYGNSSPPWRMVQWISGANCTLYSQNGAYLIFKYLSSTQGQAVTTQGSPTYSDFVILIA